MTIPRERTSTRCLWLSVAVGALAGMSGIARADDGDTDEAPPASAARSAETGALLPSGLSARSDGRRGLVAIMGGWDRARGGGIYDATAEAQLLGPVSLRAGAS